MQQQESPTQQVELQGHPLPQLGPQQIQPRDQQEDAQQQSQGALGPQPRQVAPPAQPSALLESSGTQQPSSSVSPSPASPPLAPAPRDPWRPLVQRPHMGRSLTMTAEMASTAALRRTSSIPAPSAQYKIRRGRGLPEELFSLNPEDYELKNIIGFGGSAVVHIAAYRPLSKNVAVKVIDLDRFERNQIDELRRETQVMSLCRHPHVLRVYGSFVTGSKLYIITPFLSAGSCLDILKLAHPEGIDEVSIATILRQVLLGLDYLHKNGHIHRDVKAGNLLMDENGHVLLGDFGVSSSLHDHSDMRGRRKTFVGTPCWMAPEVMEQLGYDYKADMWSFGITAIELATGHAPFSKYSPLKVVMMTLNSDPPTLDRACTKHKYSKALKEVIDMCLQKDPSKRPTAEKLLQHPFFKQAKKRRHLVSLIQNLPPIQDRPLKKQHSNSASFAKGVSWDFSSVDEDDDYKSDGSVLSVTSADGSDGRTSERAEGNEDASSEKSRQERKFLFRHEPRGDPDPSRSLSPGQELSSFQLKQSAQHEGQAQQKRGRFMVNGAESTVTDAGSGVPLTCGEPSTVTSATGCPVRKTQVKISQQEQLVGSVLGNADAAPSSPVSQQQPPHGEIRKGRFCVGPATGVQQGSATTGSSDSTPGTTQTSPCTSSLHSQYGSRRERADSWDSVGNRSDAECPERKSRFQIEPVLGQISSGGECQTGGGAGSPALPLNRAILSATGTGNLSHETSIGRTGRFAVESAAGPGSGLQETTGGQGHQSEEKRGRFSVSSVDSRIEPRNTITDGHQASALNNDASNPLSSLPGPPTSLRSQPGTAVPKFDVAVAAGVLLSHLENLLRVSDAQRAALNEFTNSLGISQSKSKPEGYQLGVGTTGFPPGLKVMPRDAHGGASAPRALYGDVSATLVTLDRQVQELMRENDALRCENASLRRELERSQSGFGTAGNQPLALGNAAAVPPLLPRESPSQTQAAAATDQKLANAPPADDQSQQHQQLLPQEQGQPPPSTQQQPQLPLPPPPQTAGAQQVSSPREAPPLAPLSEIPQ